MRIVIGSDHLGYKLKNLILTDAVLLNMDTPHNQFYDVGCFGTDMCDYVDYAQRVALIVGYGNADRGILACGSGQGMAMAANKTLNARAALCHDIQSARLSRKHNNSNILCLSGANPFALEVTREWLATKFYGGKHVNRLEKMRGASNEIVKALFWSKVVISRDHCWEWQGSKRRGYGRFNIGGRLRHAHHVAWRFIKGDFPADKQVLHRCDNPGCVNPEHLFIGTIKDNMQDMLAKGRGNKASGENHGSKTHPNTLPTGSDWHLLHGKKKLEEHQVREIRSLYFKGGCSQKQLSKRFNVAQETIGDVVNRRTWRHI